MSWIYSQDYWELGHKCTFDGVNKLVIIGPNTTTVSVKIEIYSDWKEWLLLRDNAKFLPAIRVTGGDTIGGGAFTGDIYFMTNGWRIVVDHSMTVDGVIYSDNYPSPFLLDPAVNIVTNKVSSLVNTVTGPSEIVDIATAVWSFGSRELTSTMTPIQFWNFLLTTPMVAGSAGEKLKQVLTTGNFLALK